MARSSGRLRGLVATDSWGETAAAKSSGFEELVAMALNELDPRGRLERRVQISVCSFPGQGHKNKRVRGLSAEASHRISNLRRSDVCQIAQARLAIDGLSEFAPATTTEASSTTR
jgi:hypothetical protein